MTNKLIVHVITEIRTVITLLTQYIEIGPNTWVSIYDIKKLYRGLLHSISEKKTMSKTIETFWCRKGNEEEKYS